MEEEFGYAVYCDFCDDEYTDSGQKGGYLFLGYAICPDCEYFFTSHIRYYNEEHLIYYRNTTNKSFADWIRDFIWKDEEASFYYAYFHWGIG